MSGPGNETNTAEDPWTLYRRLHGMTDQRSMDASARAVPQFQPTQYPNGMQQPMFHPGFSVPMTAPARRATYRTVGPNQANSGFGAAAFSSALGQGMGHASTPGSMKSSAFDLLGSARPQGHMQQQGFDPTSPSMPSNPAHSNQILSQALHRAQVCLQTLRAPIRFFHKLCIKPLQVKSVPYQFGMDTRAPFARV